MPLALRRYFWVTDLGFTLTAAALCALTAQALIAAHVGERAPAPFEADSKATRHGASRALDPLAIGRLFGLRPAQGDALPADARPSEPMRSALPLRLLGTAVSGAPHLSRASVENPESRASFVLAVGDAVLDATVASIDRLRVTFERAGRLEYLELGHPSDALAPVAPPPSARASLVLSSTADSYLVDAKAAHELLDNVGGELGKVLFTPERRDGALAGWRLSRLAADSALAALGLAEGDVVRRINGFSVGSPSRLAEVASRLETASRVELELERGGAVARKVYILR